MTEDDQQAILESLQDNILYLIDNQIIENIGIGMPDFQEAEKFSKKLSDYDSKLCWAATAANMLWTSGYPQQAVNPKTGNTFQTVDEVFDYFRQTFNDQTGNLE